MPADVPSYLEEVRSHLHLDPGTATRVISELDSHFQDKVADLRGQGMDDARAVREAISSFGAPRDVARLMYEAYSRGTWTEAFISLQPHVLVASLFATHLWRQPPVLALTFVVIAAIALLGWRAACPVWTYSWAGYAFSPLLVLSYLCRGVPAEAIRSLSRGGNTGEAITWIVLTAALYGVTVFVLVGAVVRVSRRDWILVSVMLLPLAVLGIWALAVERDGGTFVGMLGRLPATHELWDRSMAWLCTGLGLTAAGFVRLRARLLKGVAVVLIGMVAGALLVSSLDDGMRLGRLVRVCLGLFVLLTSPLLFRPLIGRSAERPRTTPEAHAS